MKKIITIILSILISLSLVSCGNRGNEITDTSTDTTTDTTTDTNNLNIQKHEFLKYENEVSYQEIANKVQEFNNRNKGVCTQIIENASDTYKFIEYRSNGEENNNTNRIGKLYKEFKYDLSNVIATYKYKHEFVGNRNADYDGQHSNSNGKTTLTKDEVAQVKDGNLYSINNNNKVYEETKNTTDLSEAKNDIVKCINIKLDIRFDENDKYYLDGNVITIISKETSNNPDNTFNKTYNGTYQYILKESSYEVISDTYNERTIFFTDDSGNRCKGQTIIQTYNSKKIYEYKDITLNYVDLTNYNPLKKYNYQY